MNYINELKLKDAEIKRLKNIIEQLTVENNMLKNNSTNNELIYDDMPLDWYNSKECEMYKKEIEEEYITLNIDLDDLSAKTLSDEAIENTKNDFASLEIK